MNRSTFLLALLFSLTWSPLEAQTFSAFAGDLISLPETTTRLPKARLFAQGQKSQLPRSRKRSPLCLFIAVYFNHRGRWLL